MNLLPPPGPQRWRAIGALVAIVAVLAYFLPGVFSSDPNAGAVTVTGPPRPGAAATGPGAKAQTARKAGSDLPSPVELASLEPNPDIAGPEAGRNPFRFGDPPKPPAPPPQAYVPPPVFVAPPPPPPPPPQVKLTLQLVMVTKEGVHVARMQDPNGTVFDGVEGQVIDGRYKLIKVGDRSIVVSFLDGTGQRQISVGGI